MNAWEWEAMRFQESGRGPASWYIRMKEGLDQMFNIRAWCGCRQYDKEDME